MKTRAAFWFGLYMLAAILPVSAQLKMDSLSTFAYPHILSSIWGYTAPDGKEYALVGEETGLSIVDVTTPTAPIERAFIPEPPSMWHEIKTWQHYAYVTNEQNDGILIVDMSTLPEPPTTYLRFHADSLIKTAHALYIDEAGYLYITGYRNYANTLPTNQRGVAIFDLNPNPMQPQLVGIYNQNYVHDVYVRDNIMYTGEIYAGRFAMVDINDKANPIIIGAQQTGFSFTHNVWLSDNSHYAFVADEKSGAFVEAYDVQDPQDIKFLDKFQVDPGSGLVPHNVHVYNDFIVISYYRAGVRIIDAHRPNNLIETEYFDTSPYANASGFEGCWGVYPYFSSGNIVASDRQTGLCVMRPDYIRAAYLEGTVSDAATGLPISGATITVVGTQNDDDTDFEGAFETGAAISGSYTVIVEKYGYIPYTTTVNLQSSEVTTLHIDLQPDQIFNLNILVATPTAQPIPNVRFSLRHQGGSYELQTNDSGIAVLPNVFSDDYQLYLTHWGYLPRQITQAASSTNPTITVVLDKGYYDDFSTDLGWTVSTTEGGLGAWVRDMPTLTLVNDMVCNPGSDIQGDIGEQCYFTANDTDVSAGLTSLFSPVFDATMYTEAQMRIQLWWCSSGIQSTTDFVRLYLFNGLQTVLIAELQPDISPASQWTTYDFVLSDFITPTSNMQLIIKAQKMTADAFLEVALDQFGVYEQQALSVVSQPTDKGNSEIALHIAPNPTQRIVNISLSPVVFTSDHPIVLTVYDITGKCCYTTQVNGTTAPTVLNIGDWVSGVYTLVAQQGNRHYAAKFLKM